LIQTIPIAGSNTRFARIAYQGILISGVAIVTFNRSVEQLGAAAATSIIALLPAVASGLAILVLGEIPTAAEAAAVLAIVAGALPSARPSPAAAAHAPPSI
jgi:drug/metabolite transporter (DMT)-like permease